MNDEELAVHIATVWRLLIARCGQDLEAGDRKCMAQLGSWEDIKKIISMAKNDEAAEASNLAIEEMKPTLAQFSDFFYFFEHKLGVGNSASFAWGVLGILLQLVPDDPRACEKIPRMLQSLGYGLEEFNSRYCGAVHVTRQIKKACFDMTVLIVKFITASVKTLREDDDALAYNHWKKLEENFNSTHQRFIEILGYTERFSSTSLGRMMSLPHSVSSMTLAERPTRCFLRPPATLPNLFDRDEVIENISSNLGRNANDLSFRSLTLWGVAGNGKSAIAAKYAEKSFEENEYDAVFWVIGESKTTIRQSFTDIAVRLKLPGSDPQNHDENLILIQEWFQNTDCKWLIVYDNVKSSSMLMPYWPRANRGRAIVTSIQHSLALDLSSLAIEVSSWDPKTGSQFLLELLRYGIGRDTVSERRSAYELSKRLDGHALGILQMAGIIHRKSWTITEFMTIYLKSPRRVHSRGQHSATLQNIWDFTFEDIRNKHADSLRFLGATAYLMPDYIPQSLFEFNDGSDPVEGFEFCLDEIGFSEAIEVLLELSLIKRNRDERSFSVHRMIQTQYRCFMTPDQCQEAFDDAVSLVHRAYPRMNAYGQLYEHWGECNRYQEHLMSLADYFKEEHLTSKDFRATWKFCELVNQGQRFLYETNILDSLETLCEINDLAVRTLEDPIRHEDLRASVLSHQANLYESLGKVGQAIQWNKEAYEIRLRQKPPTYTLIASFENNLGFCYNTANDHVTTLSYFDRAQATLKSQGIPCDAVKKKNMARCLFYLDKIGDARDLLLSSIEDFRKEHSLNWAMVAFAFFVLGLIERRERDSESAEASFIEAQNHWVKGDHTRLHPFNGACSYKIGVACLDQGKVEAAVKHLRDSLEITAKHRKMMPVEHARSLFKLSEALLQDPHADEAMVVDLRDQAEAYLKERSPEATGFSSELHYDILIPIFWR